MIKCIAFYRVHNLDILFLLFFVHFDDIIYHRDTPRYRGFIYSRRPDSRSRSPMVADQADRDGPRTVSPMSR